MTDAPERAYMDPDIRFSECEKKYGCDVEYIRADVAHAMVAAAYEDAAAYIQTLQSPNNRWLHANPRTIKDRAHLEARAAFKELLEQAVKEALNAAAANVEDWQAFTKYGKERISQEMASDIRAIDPAEIVGRVIG